MSRQVYIVMGQTGEYSDRTEWPVIASLSESIAAERVAALDVWLRENKIETDNPELRNASWRDRINLKTELDPNFSADYTGTSYYMMAVDLAE